MRFWRLLLVLALFVPIAVAAAGIERVGIVLSEDGGAYSEVARKIVASLSQGGRGHLEVRVLLLPARGGLRADPAELLVAVGTRAMEVLAQENLPQPMLSLLVPKEAFDMVARQSRRDPRTFSALYLDQPWSRQFALIRHALPGRKRVGVLIGPGSDDFGPQLQTAAKAAGLTAVIEKAEGEGNLLPTLKALLDESDVILAVPDPAIYNRATVPSILLTAYRHQVPLFGFSSSYVKAGAIAAVYTTPAQVGEEAGELIQRLPTEPHLPAARFPRQFSVGVNEQVTHSLGLALEDEATLDNRLKSMPETQP